MKVISKLWIVLGILVVISPLGFIIPEYFKAGSAWGEWGAEEMKNMVGYIPQGLEKLSSMWQAPLPDYAFHGWHDKTVPQLSFAYIISAIVGIFFTIAVALLLGKFLSRKEK